LNIILWALVIDLKIEDHLLAIQDQPCLDKVEVKETSITYSDKHDTRFRKRGIFCYHKPSVNKIFNEIINKYMRDITEKLDLLQKHDCTWQIVSCTIVVVVIFHNQQSDIDKLETCKRLYVFIFFTATILF